MDILERIKQSRKFVVKIGHITFTGDCPQYAKLLKIINQASKPDAPVPSDIQMCIAAIDGWEGVTEADIFPDGDPEIKVPFEKELFDDLIIDRIDWWTEISRAITESVSKRQIKKEVALKNSPAGTTKKRSKGSQAPKA